MDAGRVISRLPRRAAMIDWSKLDVLTALRCTGGIAIALIAGLASEHQTAGALVAFGAMLTSFAAFQPGYRREVAIMIAVSAGLAAATFIGCLIGGWAWVVVLLTAVLAFGAGLLVALGPTLAMLGVLTTAAYLFASDEHVGTRTALVQAALVGAGGLLTVLVIAFPWPRRPLRPERRALAIAYRSLAQYAADLHLDRSVLPDPGTIEDIRATLASAPRHSRWGRGRSIQSLADEAQRIRESLGALTLTRHRLVVAGSAAGPRRDDALAAIDAIAASTALLLPRLATAIEDDEPPASCAAFHDAIDKADAALRGLAGPNQAVVDEDVSLVFALHGQLRSVERIAVTGTVDIEARTASARSARRRPSLRGRVRDTAGMLRANITFRSTAFRHALRLAVAACAAVLLARTLPGTHGYWVAVATLVVLKPDFGTTATRGLARAAGTVTGAVLATVLAAELRPSPVVLAVLVIVMAVCMYSLYQINYGLYAIGLTSLVVFLLAFDGLPALTAATDRVIDNLIGAALAIGIFLAWPTWAATEVPRLLARMLVTQTAFGRVVFDGYIAPAARDERALASTASAARLDRANAEAAVERMANEPAVSGPLTTEVADGIVAAVHRFGLGVIVIHAHEGSARQRPMVELVPLRDAITATMAGLAGALGGEPMPALPDLRRLHVELHDNLSRANPVTGSAADGVDLVVSETDYLVDAVNTITRLVTAVTRAAVPVSVTAS